MILGVERIVQLVGGLPLALAHAGSFLSQNNISVDEYIGFYERTWAKLFDGKNTRLKRIPQKHTIDLYHVLRTG